MAIDQKCQTLSVTIIALNEEERIARCLKSVNFAQEIILIDGGSRDKTVEIAKQHGAQVYLQQEWKGYGAQKNIAMSYAKGPWVLNLDADEVITPQLQQEIIGEIQSSKAASGYEVARKTFYLGKWIRFGGWYPNYVTRLSQKNSCSWTEPNVHEALKINGEIRKLKNPLHHFTFKNIEHQIQTNIRYAKQGSQDLARKGKKSSVFWLLVKPIGKFFETYFLKLGFLDGMAGLIISINAAYSMFMKWAFLLEKEKNEKNSSP